MQNSDNSNLIEQLSELEEIFLKKIDSTQLFARREAEILMNVARKPYVIRANEQTSGIGQKDRKWVSPPDNFFATFIIPWSLSNIAVLGHVQQVTAVSVAQALEKLDFHPQIKWVNDILIGDKKVSGILAESILKGEEVIVLIGIGINTNLEPGSNVLDQPITSLKVEKKVEHYDTAQVHEVLKKILLHNLEKLKGEGFSSFLDYMKSHAAFQGKKVRIAPIKEGQEIIGIYEGLTNEGYLQIQVDGERRVLSDGRMFLIRD